jgi:hypothetical protein
VLVQKRREAPSKCNGVVFVFQSFGNSLALQVVSGPEAEDAMLAEGDEPPNSPYGVLTLNGKITGFFFECCLVQGCVSAGFCGEDCFKPH